MIDTECIIRNQIEILKIIVITVYNISVDIGVSYILGFIDIISGIIIECKRFYDIL